MRTRFSFPCSPVQAAIRSQAIVGVLVGILIVGGVVFLFRMATTQNNSGEATTAKGREASIILGEEEVESGLKLLDFGDGPVTVTNMGGVSCVQLRNRFDSYLYLSVDPKLKTSSHMNAIIHVEFLAMMGGRFDVQFDGYKFGERPASVYSDTPVGVRFDRWPHWHQVAMEISNARFANRQNNGADLRLRVNCPLFYVRSVRLTDIEDVEEATAVETWSSGGMPRKER